MNNRGGLEGGSPGDQNISKAKDGTNEARTTDDVLQNSVIDARREAARPADATRGSDQPLASAGSIESGVSNVARLLAQPNEQYGTLGKACAAECPEGMKELMRTAQEVQQNYAKLASAGFTADVDPKQGKNIMAALEKVTKAV